MKRLLTRSGQSEYYINNLHVRRKDITDLFLGTGLGPRAYAIIGQGTISRIIEARPDELRVFLEEAAGVTKYKERRKETEGPIVRHAREPDAGRGYPRRTWAPRWSGSKSQAAVARQFRDADHEDADAQATTALVAYGATRRRPSAQRVALRSGTRRRTNSKGRMRRCARPKRKLEEARERPFHAATDGVQSAQSENYKASAEVARLEAEIRHRRENRSSEYESRLTQLRGG